MAEKLVTVASFWTVSEAYLVKAWLEDEGIECCIADEHVIGATGIMAIPVGGVKVQVRESDAEVAAKLLKERETETQPLDESFDPGAPEEEEEE